MESNIKNDKQIHYNQIKGNITELNDGIEYCSVTLKVGHEKVRDVNVSMKKEQFDAIKDVVSINQRVLVKYFLVSRKKHDRWHSSANLIELLVDSEIN
jgi:hypothetical protein